MNEGPPCRHLRSSKTSRSERLVIEAKTTSGTERVTLLIAPDYDSAAWLGAELVVDEERVFARANVRLWADAAWHEVIPLRWQPRDGFGYGSRPVVAPGSSEFAEACSVFAHWNRSLPRDEILERLQYLGYSE